jgi:hypothetical protein
MATPRDVALYVAAGIVVALAVSVGVERTSGVPLSRSLRNIVGDPCLPLDIVGLVRSEHFEAVRQECQSQQDGGCSVECMRAVYALKEQRCFPSLTQPQHLQPRHATVNLAGMPGNWYGLYPASGVELLELRYDPATSTLSATKLTGNTYVRAGRVSWEATPSGCRVVSSLWAGVYTPRWDPCTLTMWGTDHLTVDLGGSEEETIAFVRAQAPLLLGWDEPRAPTHGAAAAFERCSVPVAPASLDQSLTSRLMHHSQGTVVLDQMLLIVPMVLVGMWQLEAEEGSGRGLLYAIALCWAFMLVGRLSYLGLMSG